jgi:hypothetical protein
MEIASQRGHPPRIINRIYTRLQKTADLPENVSDWISWTIELFKEDASTLELLGTSRESIFDALGKKRGAALQHADWARIKAAVLAWISGAPLQDIEEQLGFLADDLCCNRAREIAIDLAPKGFSFAIGLIAQIAKLVASERGQDYPLLEYLSTLVRRGFDTTDLLDFANVAKVPLCRVQFHKAFRAKSILRD